MSTPERDYWDPPIRPPVDREVAPRYDPQPLEPAAAHRDMRRRECVKPSPRRR